MTTEPDAVAAIDAMMRALSPSQQVIADTVKKLTLNAGKHLPEADIVLEFSDKLTLDKNRVIDDTILLQLHVLDAVFHKLVHNLAEYNSYAYLREAFTSQKLYCQTTKLITERDKAAAKAARSAE